MKKNTTTKSIHLCVFFLGLLFLTSTGCSVVSKVWPPYATMSIITSQNVNPDINQRPSPVQVKIYELSSRATFDSLDFDSLFYQGKTLLSDELLSEATFTAQPDEVFEHIVYLQEKSGFIAVMAAYRNIDNAKWKHIYAVNPHGHYKKTITLGRSAIYAGELVDITEKKNKNKTTIIKKQPSNYRDDTEKPTKNNNDNIMI